MKNIVLIGMPGCGKTTISKRLQEKTGLPLIDLDEYLVEKYQMSIESMFDISEDYFRARETEVCKDVKDYDGYIISCGGGVILREENMQYLKENGIIYHLERDLGKIIMQVSTDGRPLLKAGTERIAILYHQRKHLYEKYRDIAVDNNGSFDHTIEQIIKTMP